MTSGMGFIPHRFFEDMEDIAVSLFGLQYRLRVVSLRELGAFMRRLRSRSEKVEVARRQVPSNPPLLKFSAGSSQGSELDPCLAWVHTEQKAATNGGQIRRPFHPDC